MSVITGKVYNDKIVIAADSIVLSRDLTRSCIKIANINNMIIGATGTLREAALMFNFMETHRPANATQKDVLSFLIEFIDWKRKLINNANLECHYLLAYDGHLFLIMENYVEEINDYYAIGAGRDYAMAALYLGHSPREAVKTACDLCCYVAEPIIEFEQSMKE